MPVDNLAAFESLRRLAADAVTQLTTEMAQQQKNYDVPAEDVLSLIKAVGATTGQSPWVVWETWALRHAVPVHGLIAKGQADANRDVMRKRLQDLLGYALLGLALCGTEKK